jgi:hypothetical protein
MKENLLLSGVTSNDDMSSPYSKDKVLDFKTKL